jgi:serine/threonine protein phosphatase PrpC
MVVTNYSRIVWVSAGNTRLYLFRKGRLGLKSKDQSIAQLAADSGKITHDEIAEHEERFNLTNYLGKPSGLVLIFQKNINLWTEMCLFYELRIGKTSTAWNCWMLFGDVYDPSDLVESLKNCF